MCKLMPGLTFWQPLNICGNYQILFEKEYNFLIILCSNKLEIILKNALVFQQKIWNF
jgi:hypothetical protein